METIEIKRENAIKAYENAGNRAKKVLEDLFGKNVFYKNVIDRVKTFEDALSICPLPDDLDFFLKIKSTDKQLLRSQAHAKICIIAKALNEGWEPDYTNSNQYKYYPWFVYAPGVGFSSCVYSCGTTSSAVGSRLCFKSKELAMYAGKQFQSIYNDFLN